MPRGLVHEETVILDASDPKAQAHNAEVHFGQPDDEARLRQLGYKQELRRELNLLKNFAVSFGLLSMLTGLGGYYSFGFLYGGPVVVVWGWVLIVAMTLTIALSMAEICSSLPTTGGVYFWAGVLGGKSGPLMAWITGMLNLLGQVGITAGVEYTVVNYCLALIKVKDPDFSFTSAQFWAVYFGFTVFHGVLNSISTRVLGWLSIISVFWHVLGTLIIVIGLPIVAPTHQAASWVFGEFIPPSDAPANADPPGVGISNHFYIFLIGLLVSQWAMVGYDSSAHIAEETKNAAVAGPVGLIMAICGSFICGWMFQLSLTFSIQDLADAYNGSMAIIQGVFNARYGFGSGSAQAGSISFMVIMFVASQFCGTFCVTSNSRMLYAFARDVPALSWFAKVNTATGTPINSIIVMVLAASALGLTMLGSTVAFNAIASIGIIGLQLSYLLPIALRLTVARKWFKKGPFHLGPLSHAVGWISVIWGMFICVVLVLPTTYPITTQNLNYSSVAVGGVLILSLISWVLSARKWFKGPVRNVDTGNKTEVLSEAYMRGELDESDALFGNESAAPPKGAFTSADEVPKM